MKLPWRTHVAILAVLAVLCVAAYAPLFVQPLLEDDYPNIELARSYGPVSGWSAMLSDGVFYSRATFWILTSWLDRLFGVAPGPYHAASIALHVLAVWALYALGVWRALGWRLAAAAGAFFAVYEGHQEAVMWYSAASDELMFVFGMLSLVCWIRYLQSPPGRGWYWSAFVLFTLALLSKESGVIFAPLMLLPLWGMRAARRGLRTWVLFALLAVYQVWTIWDTNAYSFRFRDGSFSLAAPFWITWPVSYGRLLWVWGLFSLLALLWVRARPARHLAITALGWIGVALVPYSFLTYMHRIPSRQVYLASAGLALLVAAAGWALQTRLRRQRSAVLAGIVLTVLVANIGYIWTTKRRQFLERAAPTEALVSLARKVNGPIYMRCYPGIPLTAEAAVRLRAGKPASTLVWDAAKANTAAAEFCFTRR